MASQVLGLSYLWSPDDGLPVLAELPGFRAQQHTDTALLVHITELAPHMIAKRLYTGHLAYVAWLDTTPVAYGWVATQQHGIEELALAYDLLPRHRALWDFRTLEAWRGRGVYSRLLQAILRAEAPHADWVEISHVIGNVASQRGIIAAGFHLSNQIVMTEDGQVRLAPVGDQQRAPYSAMGQAVGFAPAQA